MKFYETLVSILKNEPNFIDDDGNLKKWVVINKAQEYDESLLSILITNEETKKNFFIFSEEYTIFKKDEFVEFLEQKNFLNDSFTKFQNKIGIQIGGKYFNQIDNVKLVWPFKDCLLEGGESKEEKKRDEIFFNQILAIDEITQLKQPKVLSNPFIFDQKGKNNYISFRRDKKININRKLPTETITDNIIVKGNNLLALYSLKREFINKVKLIYIDPPFNTGNDSFNYNDKFNHSTWLTFMHNRLIEAKKFLKKDGIIVVHVDNVEAAYTQVLLDEIFKKENYLNHITLTTNAPSGFKATSSKIFSTANHIYFYANDIQSTELKKIYLPKRLDSAYKYFLKNPEEHYSKWVYGNLIEEIAKRSGFENKKELTNSLSKSEFLARIEKFVNEFKSQVFRTAAISGGALKKRKTTIDYSKANKNIVMKHPDEDIENFYILNGEQIVFWSNTFKYVDGESMPAQTLTDVWTDISFTGIANEGGVVLKDGKKPERLIKRIIEITTNPGDIVLDYHLGSGTTAAVAMKMQRQFIGIEQLDYKENDSISRLVNVINGDKTGISKDKDVKWNGGGSFISFELKKYNQNFIDLIEKAKDKDSLLKIWGNILKYSIIKYNIDIKKLNSNFDEFEKYELKQQKQILYDILDQNFLYVNLPSLNDKDFKCSSEEKKITRDFYQIKE